MSEELDVAPPVDDEPITARAARAAARVPQAEALVRLAEERYRLSRTPEGEPFAVERDGPNIARMLRGAAALRQRLAADYRREYGRPPSAAALAGALTVIEGLALDTSPEPVALRVARHGTGIVVDLGDEIGHAVIVEPRARRVVDRSPILFRRSELTGALPMPEHGGNLADLRDLLHVGDETWPLVEGWCLAALIPDVPVPILLFGGEHGAGKSTAARLIVGLLDPSPAPLRCEPRDVEQWCVAASASRVVAIDNVSGIPAWWSDALCRGVTGDALIRRQLYSNADLSVLALRRAVILTSIDPGALRGDLGDRLLLADLEPIPDAERRTEEELDREYQRLRPGLVGALFDRLAAALAALPHVHQPDLPRMADFGRVLAALDDLDDGDRLDTYCGQRGRVAQDVIESDPVAVALVRALDVAIGAELAGTAGELLDLLRPERLPRGWPASPRAMAARIKRLRPALHAVGVTVIAPSDVGRTGHGRSRRYLVYRTATEGAPERPSGPSASCANRTGAPENAESLRTSPADDWGPVRRDRPHDRPQQSPDGTMDADGADHADGSAGAFSVSDRDPLLDLPI